MRADELRRELQEIANEQPAPAGDARAVVARGSRRLLRRRLGVGFALLAVLGVTVGIAASARDGSPKGVVIAPPPTPAENAGPQVIFTSEEEGWVCADPILHTADGGEHWQAQSWSNLATGTPTCAAVPTDAWIVVQSPTGDVKVLPAQGGANIAVTIGFPALPEGAKVAQAMFVDRNDGWVLVRPAGNAVGHGLLYRTTTGTGPITFELVSSVAPIGQVQFVSATEGWGIDGGAIVHTTDGGASWSGFGTPGLQPGTTNWSFFGIAVHEDTVVVAGTDELTPGEIVLFVSSDAGRSWGARHGPKITAGMIESSALEVIDAAQWRLTFDGQLWATGDGGLEWTEVLAPPNLASISFPSIESNWATDASGAAYRWSDAGPKWERIDTTPQGPWHTDLVSVPGNPGGCPTIDKLGVHSGPQEAARDFVRATRGWTDVQLLALYPVTQPGGQFGEVFAVNVARQCGQAVADASYAIELANPSITQDSSGATALVAAPIGGEWKVWGFYR
jgi:photosystem II stability/assembly factor-like uncharacterized protein